MKKKTVLIIVLVVAATLYVVFVVSGFNIEDESVKNFISLITAIGALITSLIAVVTLISSLSESKKTTEEMFIRESINRLFKDIGRFRKYNETNHKLTFEAHWILSEIELRLYEKPNSIRAIIEIYNSIVNVYNYDGREFLDSIYAEIYTCHEFIVKSSHLSEDEKCKWFKILHNMPQDILMCHLLSTIQIYGHCTDEELFNELKKDDAFNICMKYNLYSRLSLYDCYNRLINKEFRDFLALKL